MEASDSVADDNEDEEEERQSFNYVFLGGGQWLLVLYGGMCGCGV